jgi:hypothetical protein
MSSKLYNLIVSYSFDSYFLNGDRNCQLWSEISNLWPLWFGSLFRITNPRGSKSKAILTDPQQLIFLTKLNRKRKIQTMSGFNYSGYPIPHRRAFKFVTNHLPMAWNSFWGTRKKIRDIALYKDGKCTHKKEHQNQILSWSMLFLSKWTAGG